jgi:hypothetical protein
MRVNFCSDYFNLLLVRPGDGIRDGQRPCVFYLHLFDSFSVQLEADHFPRQELAWVEEVENGVDDCDVLVQCTMKTTRSMTETYSERGEHLRSSKSIHGLK